MAVVGSSEQLVELLREAARIPGGEIGLLKRAQVARILGRCRDWVHRNAPSTVAAGSRPQGRRLAYPPAKQTLADRPRRAITDPQGGLDAATGTRQR